MAVRLRGLQEGDVTPLERILKANAPVFNETEVRAAVDMLLGGVGGPATTDGYRFIVAETDDGKVAGYALFAHTPLTVGTWDLYWIAADPAAHGRGVGPKLLRAVEEVVKNEGGRLVVIETSSRPDYARARRFYERSGYKKTAVLDDFYKEGDHKVVYTRRIDKGESRRLNVPNLAQEPKSATP
jgi:ribosomal protein S18 acetylase RimI-like enzyme